MFMRILGKVESNERNKKSFRSYLHSTDCIRARHVPDAGCTMVFVGPTIAILLSAIGWLGLLGAAPFSVAYIVRAYKEGVHGKALSVFAAIFQFFFTMDVIFVIILAIKDRVYSKQQKQQYQQYQQYIR